MAYDPSFSASFLDSHADGDAKGNADLLRLRKVWLDERMSPELLPYETELVQRVREVLRLQQENINTLLDDMRQNGENMDAATVDRRRMEAPMLEMELDRVKFVLASYLRSRLKKLDQNIMYALSTPAVVERLSEAEMQYAAGYVDMLGDAFQKSFLDHLPPQFQSLTEKEMIDAPDLDKFVAFRVKEHIGDYVCTDQNGKTVEVDLQLEENDLVVGRFFHYRTLLAEGRIDMV